MGKIKLSQLGVVGVGAKINEILIIINKLHHFSNIMTNVLRAP